MPSTFWKSVAISIFVYTVALLSAVFGDFRITLFIVLALQVTWTPFCGARVIQLRLEGAHKTEADEYSRESYSFALGGLTSSLLSLAAMIVATQVV
jgi:hypothetical protein